MPSLEEVVSVSITRGTRVPSRQGFGTPLVLIPYAFPLANECRTYTSLAGVVADGFDSGTALYKAAAAIFSQTPSVKRARFLSVNTAVQHAYEAYFTGWSTGESVTITIKDDDGGVATATQSFTVDLATSMTALLASLTGAIAANISGAVTLTNVSGTLTIARSGSIGRPLFVSVEGGMALPVVLDVTPAAGYPAALNALFATDQDFYAVAALSNSEANVLDLAAWTLANKRLAVVAPSATPALYTDTAEALEAASNDRVMSVPTKNPREAFLDCAILGYVLSQDPGRITWEYKPIAGPAADVWTATDELDLRDLTCAFYSSVAGLNGLINTRVASGAFVDLTRDSDWLTAQIKERVFAKLASAPKLPYTDQGVQVLVNEVAGALKEGERVGVLAPGSSLVEAIPVADVSPLDRASRHYPGVTFSATFAGAIHTVRFEGTLEV